MAGQVISPATRAIETSNNEHSRETTWRSFKVCNDAAIEHTIPGAIQLTFMSFSSRRSSVPASSMDDQSGTSAPAVTPKDEMWTLIPTPQRVADRDARR